MAHKRHSLSVFLLTIVACVLSACSFHATGSVQADGAVSIHASLEDESGQLLAQGYDCNEIQSRLASWLPSTAQIEQKDTTSGTTLNCEFDATTVAGFDGTFLTQGKSEDEDGKSVDSLTLFIPNIYPPADSQMKALATLVDFSVDVTMPGEILQASDGVEKKDNTIHISKLSTLMEPSGTTVISRMDGNVHTSSHFSPFSHLSGAKIVAIAGGLILAIGALILIISRHKRKASRMSQVPTYEDAADFFRENSTDFHE